MKNLFVLFLFLPIICMAAPKKILFLGDSLTEGYGVKREKSYPYLLEQHFNKTQKLIKVINGGVSGSTTSSGLERLNWHIKRSPEILFLALGANDGLRGISLKVTFQNLEKIIQTALDKKIKVVLAGMLLPLNYGKKYRDDFEKGYKELAKKFDVIFIPFLLDGVARKKEFNIDDGIHPNEKGHEKIKNNVIPFLKKLI